MRGGEARERDEREEEITFSGIHPRQFPNQGGCVAIIGRPGIGPSALTFCSDTRRFAGTAQSLGSCLCRRLVVETSLQDEINI